MAAENQSFVMTAGDSLDLDIAVDDLDAGGRKDLAGAVAEWALAAEKGGTPLVTKTSQAPAGTITFPDAPGGVLRVPLEAADTQGLAGLYHYQARVSSGGRRQTTTRGTITIHASSL